MDFQQTSTYNIATENPVKYDSNVVITPPTYPKYPDILKKNTIRYFLTSLEEKKIMDKI